MIVKAYIQKIENDGYSYKVRIPILHKLKNSPGAVPDNELPSAPICTLPGIFPHYSIGDVVWVAFENDELGMPVILGFLPTSTNFLSTSYVNCDSIKVNMSADLPVDTNIGEVTKNSIQALPQIYAESINYGDILDGEVNS